MFAKVDIENNITTKRSTKVVHPPCISSAIASRVYEDWVTAKKGTRELDGSRRQKWQNEFYAMRLQALCDPSRDPNVNAPLIPWGGFLAQTPVEDSCAFVYVKTERTQKDPEVLASRSSEDIVKSARKRKSPPSRGSGSEEDVDPAGDNVPESDQVKNKKVKKTPVKPARVVVRSGSEMDDSS